MGGSGGLGGSGGSGGSSGRAVRAGKTGGAGRVRTSSTATGLWVENPLEIVLDIVDCQPRSISN